MDNGSEYINRHVAELLNKLLIEEFTKSRSRPSVREYGGTAVRAIAPGHQPESVTAFGLWVSALLEHGKARPRPNDSQVDQR